MLGYNSSCLGIKEDTQLFCIKQITFFNGGINIINWFFIEFYGMT